MEFKFLGAGYILYFRLLKWIITLLFVFSIFHIYMIYRNVNEGQCQKYPAAFRCTEDYILAYSVANYGINYDKIELVTGFLIRFSL